MSERVIPGLAAPRRWRASPRRRLAVGLLMLVLGVAALLAGGAYAVTARPVNPVEVDGHISAYTEVTVNGAYARNELRLAGDIHTYLIDGGQFHPALPSRFLKDGRVVLWVDRGTPDVLAITLYDELGLNPETYTTTDYDHPTLAGRGRQIGGSIAALLGLVLLLAGLVWAFKIPSAHGVPAATRTPRAPVGPIPWQPGEAPAAAGKMPAIRAGADSAPMPPAAAGPSAPMRPGPVASGPGGASPPPGALPPSALPPSALPPSAIPPSAIPPQTAPEAYQGVPNQGMRPGPSGPPPGAWAPQSWAAAFGAPAGPSGPRAPGAQGVQGAQGQAQPGGWAPPSAPAAPGAPTGQPYPPQAPVSGPGPNQWPAGNTPSGPPSPPHAHGAPAPQPGYGTPPPPEPPRR
jgi:hypothetical protein